MSLTFLAPQFLWALLAIPIVVALHFIRARKRRYEVSALFLWKQAKEIAEARRRFNPSWLLLLQILFVTLAALALAQPNFSSGGPPDRVLVVDVSASMAARDSDGVRLDKAIAEAKTLLRGAGRVAVVRAGLDATTVQPPTDDTGAASAALDALRAADREADLGRALSLALAIAPEAEVHLFTDSEPPPENRAVLHAVGGDALNLGVSTFDIGLRQAFVAVASNHPRPQEVGLELVQEGQLVAQTTLLVPAEGQANVSFPLPDSSGFFEARLDAPSWDALELDNTAFAGKRDLRVVLNTGNRAVERALASIPNLTYQVLPNAAPDAPGFDARVLIGALPEGAQGNYLLFSPPVEEPVYATIRSWDRSDPLLRFVDLSETRVGLNPDGVPFEGEGWQTLAQTADLTPVLLRQEGQGLTVVAANFNPTQTDVVNRSAFPLLLTNVMNSFRNEASLTLGEPLPEGSSIRSTSGSGERNLARSRVTEPGLYTVNNQTYAASLFSTAETRLPSFTPVESETPPPSLETSERVRNAALWLVAVAALFLLAEWLLFSCGRSGWRWQFWSWQFFRGRRGSG